MRPKYLQGKRFTLVYIVFILESCTLLGIRFNQTVDLRKLQENFVENKLYNSLRGTAVRVSVNIFNDQNDMDKLVECIKSSIQSKNN